MQTIPTLDSALFVGLVIFLVGFSTVLAGKVSVVLRNKMALFLAFWLIATGFLATQEFFHDFSKLPPRPIIPALLFTFVGIFFLRTSSGSAFLESSPNRWIIGFQAFRILMEVILWLVYEHGIIPVQMTFEGHNFDILVGLTAPIVAYLLHTKRIGKTAVIAWNIFGLCLLTNIIVVSALSAPSPFRVFMNEPANTFIAYFPFVWLVAFVVPIAFLGHIASMMQAWKK